MVDVRQATICEDGRPRFRAPAGPSRRADHDRESGGTHVGRARGRQVAGRRGVTLLELLLVLAVLTLVGAVAWPSLDRSFADQRLRNAADMVRAQWTQAQVRAVASGTVQYFQSETGGRHYWLESADDADSAGNTPSDGSLSLSAGVPSNALLLPDDVTFDSVTVEAPASCDVFEAFDQSMVADSTTLGNDTSGATVAFYPDGACSSVRLVLRNSYDHCIAVSLQGVTGLATVSDVFAAEGVTP